jgi:dTDP-4-dehydrorhamnose 3,5-epimerase
MQRLAAAGGGIPAVNSTDAQSCPIIAIVAADRHVSPAPAPDRDLEVVPSGVRDVPTVSEGGQRRSQIDGVVVIAGAVHSDHRGTLMETVNFDSPFWEESVVYAYTFTVAPGRIKGWGMHRLQTDRYAALAGPLRVVLYDGRVDSPTFQQFAEFHFSDEAPGFLRIPPGVWHADQNVGEVRCRVINFPTRPYDRDDPDKYRIDPDSGEIPFDFTLRDS